MPSHEHVWKTLKRPRIPPLAPLQRGPVAHLASIGGMPFTGGPPPRIFTTLARHPGLFRNWLVFARKLVQGGLIPTIDRELIILRTAYNCGSAYEYGHHVYIAKRAGLRQSQINLVSEGPDALGWSDHQRTLLRATDELHDQRLISDNSWKELRQVYNEKQAIEFCFLVGHYEMLAMALNSLGVQPEMLSERRVLKAGK